MNLDSTFDKDFIVAHFEFVDVAGEKWRRYGPKGIEGGSTDARWHIVATSEFGVKLILDDTHDKVSERFFKELAAELKFNKSNRRVSMVTEGKGLTRFGYRFKRKPNEEQCRRFIELLDKIAEDLELLSVSQ